MTDAELITEVASALYHELDRQDTKERTTLIGVDCEALARVAIESYLGIQRRLVTTRLQEWGHSESPPSGETPGPWCGVQSPTTPHLSCQLQVGHLGDHRRWEASWPQDGGEVV